MAHSTTRVRVNCGSGYCMTITFFEIGCTPQHFNALAQDTWVETLAALTSRGIPVNSLGDFMVGDAVADEDGVAIGQLTAAGIHRQYTEALTAVAA